MKRNVTLKLWMFAAALLAAAAYFPSNLHAQAISGDLVGIVTDATGAAIPNVSVTATNDATGIKTTAVTDPGGAYRMANLPVGLYTLTATLTGFAAWRLQRPRHSTRSPEARLSSGCCR